MQVHQQPALTKYNNYGLLQFTNNKKETFKLVLWKLRNTVNYSSDVKLEKHALYLAENMRHIWQNLHVISTVVNMVLEGFS